jgi:hypothetical protein
MPANITDVDVFTDPVQAPADGDPGNGATFQLSPQALANRTRHNKNRLDAIDPQLAACVTDLEARAYDGYVPANTPDGTPDTEVIPIAGLGTSTGWALASNELQVPSAGYYLILLRADVSMPDNTVSDPKAAIVAIRVGGTIVGYATGRRWSAEGTDLTTITGHVLHAISTPATEKITFTNESGTDLVFSTGALLDQFVHPFQVLRVGNI